MLRRESEFLGQTILESVFLEQDGLPITVYRTWYQRLFTLPWRPFRKSYIVIPRVPYEGALRIDSHTLVMHPVTLAKLREQLKSERPETP